MSLSPRDLEAFMAVTRPSAESCAAVGRRVLGGSPTSVIDAAVLGHMKSPGTAAAHRVTARVLLSGARPRALWPRRAALGAGAFALIGFTGAAFAALYVANVADTPVHEHLQSEPIVLVGATLEPSGQGQLTGSERRPLVRWESGALTVRGVATVHTREAVITTDGTVQITRDLYGTSASGPGLISTQCLASFDPPAASVGCPPVSAAGLLALAVQRGQDGASAEERLSWLALAGSMQDTALEADVRVVAVAAHFDAGDRAEVVRLATLHVADEHAPSRLDVAMYGASAAILDEDCARAMPFLRLLASDDADAALHLAACATQDAEQAIDNARRHARDLQDLSQIDALQRRLLQGPR